MKKLFRKIKEYYFGKCYKLDHNWKMRRGWQSNPECVIEVHGINDPKFPMFKGWIHYRCKRCGAISEK